MLVALFCLGESPALFKQLSQFDISDEIVRMNPDQLARITYSIREFPLSGMRTRQTDQSSSRTRVHFFSLGICGQCTIEIFVGEIQISQYFLISGLFGCPPDLRLNTTNHLLGTFLNGIYLQ